jgi:hypothetical protein
VACLLAAPAVGAVRGRAGSLGPGRCGDDRGRFLPPDGSPPLGSVRVVLLFEARGCRAVFVSFWSLLPGFALASGGAGSSEMRLIFTPSIFKLLLLLIFIIFYYLSYLFY